MSVQVKQLKSGITILVNRQKRMKTSSIAVGVRVGSGYETDATKYGVSHFIEHVLFKGTKTRTAEQLLEQAEYVGCTFNAYTGDNQTVYYIEGLAKNIKTHLDVLLDCVFNSVFPESEMEKEREVIKQEILMYEDDPMSNLEELHNQTVYEGSWAEHNVIGTIETVDSITRDDLIEFYKQWYKPERIIVSAYGNVTLEQIESYIEDFIANKTDFNGYTKPFEGYPILPDPNFKTNIRAVKTKEGIQQTYALWSFNLVQPRNRAFCVFFNELMIGGFSTILYKRIREELGLVYSFGTSPLEVQGNKVLNFFAICDRENVPVIEKEILKSLNDIKNGKMSLKLIRKAKNNREYCLLDCIEKRSQNAVDVVCEWINTGRYVEPVDLRPVYKAIKKEDVVNFVQEHFDLNNFNVLQIVPCDDE